MRKDVKRAMLLWPLVASATVIAVTSLPLWQRGNVTAPTPLSQFAVSRPALSSSMLSDAPMSVSDLGDTGLCSGLMHVTVDSAHRDDHGLRGLALPTRLAEAGLAGNLRELNASAGDKASTREGSTPQGNQNDVGIALLAPVLDPVAELAGYSRATDTRLIPPSQLAPGLEDPASATHVAPEINWASLPATRPHTPSVDWRLAQSDSDGSLPRLLPTNSEATETLKLVPSSVEVLGKPSVESRSGAIKAPRPGLSSASDRATASLTNPAGWPAPKQLRLELAKLCMHGGIAGISENGTDVELLTSVERSASTSSASNNTTLQQGTIFELADPRAAKMIGTSLERRATAIVMGRWAEQVENGLENLRSLPRIGDSEAANVIRQLNVLSIAGLQLAERAPARDQQSQWLRAAHALSRRTEVWKAVWQLASDQDARLYLNGTLSGIQESESQSLRLISQAPNSASLGPPDQRYGEPVDYAALLADLERQESESVEVSTTKIGDAFRSLRLSNQIDAVRVAKAIDVNYRNANVRTAISADLLNRLIPAVPSKTVPLRTNLLGTRVTGTSHVSSTLGLQLVPSPDSWMVQVRTSGDVNTDSRGVQSGVTVFTDGRSHFEATTPLEIRTNGFQVGHTHVSVQGNNHLTGVQTKYDAWPLLGSMVQRIARKRFAETRPIANQVSDSRIRSDVTQELDSNLQTRSLIAEQKLDQFVLGPLGELDLQPRVIALETTPSRLIARYRLASDVQLAANTPRPRAWSDSWLSVQIHQSALNNTLEQLLPSGDTKTFEELFGETMSLFGQDDAILPTDVPAKAEIEFSRTRPITLEIESGKVWLTFRVVSLSQPGSAKLRRFIVRAAYTPRVGGLDAKLVRDGHLRISGPGMSMRQRLPIRAIFNKVLSEERSLPLTLPKLTEHPAASDLVISQLELRDGWMALAIAPQSTPRVAVRP